MGNAVQNVILSSRLQRRQVLAGGIAAAMLAGCGAKPGTSQQLIYAADSQADGHPSVESIKAMGRYLEEKSNGRLGVKLYPGGQLGSEQSTLEIAMFGGLGMTRVFSAALNNIAPLTKLFSLPFLFQSTEHQRRVIDGQIGEDIMTSLEPFNLRGLAIYDTGGRGFYTRGRSIRQPSDLNGLKIRVPNSDIFLDTVRALGANPTPMNFSEVYQGLVQKVIDGAENNWPSYITTRHYEVADYFSETGHFRTPDMLVMSLRTWRSFSPADQDIVKEAARYSVEVMRSLWDARVATSKKTLLDNGGQILSDIDITPFKVRMAPVYEKFVTADLKPYVAQIDQIAKTGS